MWLCVFNPFVLGASRPCCWTSGPCPPGRLLRSCALACGRYLWVVVCPHRRRGRPHPSTPHSTACVTVRAAVPGRASGDSGSPRSVTDGRPNITTRLKKRNLPVGSCPQDGGSEDSERGGERAAGRQTDTHATPPPPTQTETETERAVSARVSACSRTKARHRICTGSTPKVDPAPGTTSSAARTGLLPQSHSSHPPPRGGESPLAMCCGTPALR